MSGRSISPWGDFQDDHGRLRLVTPVTQPIVESLYTLATRERRRQRSKWVLALLLLALAGLLWAGCGVRT